jgi:phosphoserine phosphatase RsbU/P
MSYRILVVDDESDLEDLITQKFKREIREKEFEFGFAGNGVEALAKLKDEGEFDLVLTDINMPEMDGLTLLSRMKEMDNHLLRSVIVSAYGDLGNIRTAMNRGAYDFVIKPIDFNDLEITIRKCLEDLRLFKEAVRSRDRLISIERELGIARAIQTTILPTKSRIFSERKEFDLSAEMIAAREVGGDLYDFFFVDRYRLGLVIGDVSGKGVPAALLMTVTKTLLKATALKGIPTDTCLETVNRVLVEESLASMFVTLFYGVLDTRSGMLEYTLGGHNPPYLLSKGCAQELKCQGGLIVGAIKQAEYQSNVLMLSPGDTIFLYTDGITEATNRVEEMYETGRLTERLNQCGGMVPEQLIRKVIEDVQLFAGGAEQSDDMTCLAVSYHGPSSA